MCCLDIGNVPSKEIFFFWNTQEVFGRLSQRFPTFFNREKAAGGNKFFSAFLDADFKSAVSALTAGSTFFCVKAPVDGAKDISSPQARSLTDFLNEKTSSSTSTTTPPTSATSNTSTTTTSSTTTSATATTITTTAVKTAATTSSTSSRSSGSAAEDGSGVVCTRQREKKKSRES